MLRVSDLHYRFCLLCLLFLRLLPSLAASLTHNFDFVYRRTLSTAQDGVLNNAIFVNGQFLGPVIRGNVGDFVIVNVTNLLSIQETLTVHWHGIRQLYTPWSDGTAYITNCPIVYGSVSWAVGGGVDGRR